MLLKLNIKEEQLKNLVKLLKSEGLETPESDESIICPQYRKNQCVEVLVTYDEYIIIKDYEEESLLGNDRQKRI